MRKYKIEELIVRYVVFGVDLKVRVYEFFFLGSAAQSKSAHTLDKLRFGLSVGSWRRF